MGDVCEKDQGGADLRPLPVRNKLPIARSGSGCTRPRTGTGSGKRERVGNALTGAEGFGPGPTSLSRIWNSREHLSGAFYSEFKNR